MTTNEKVLDLLAAVEDDLEDLNLGKARAKLDKISALVTKKVTAKAIEQGVDEAASNTDKVRAALRELAEKTPDEIAAFLLKKGHKGKRGDSRNCPMAKYLQSLDGDLAVARSGVQLENAARDYIENPDSVRSFVGRFDSDRYLDLVEDSTENPYSPKYPKFT